MTDYLTKADAGERGTTVRLKIPNREAASIFEDTVVRLFRETIDTDTQRRMMDAFWNQDPEEAGRAISELLWRTISYHDYHEDYYHAFLAGAVDNISYGLESSKEKGVLAGAVDNIGYGLESSKEKGVLAGAVDNIGYGLEFDKEKGLGRPDILLKDEDHRRAILIETKNHTGYPTWKMTVARRSGRSSRKSTRKGSAATSRGSVTAPLFSRSRRR